VVHLVDSPMVMAALAEVEAVLEVEEAIFRPRECALPFRKVSATVVTAVALATEMLPLPRTILPFLGPHVNHACASLSKRVNVIVDLLAAFLMAMGLLLLQLVPAGLASNFSVENAIGVTSADFRTS